jgi:hypothetical protein
MYITQNAREAKANQAIIVTLAMLAVAAVVWMVSRLLSR